jgi:Glycosyl transferase family 2
MPQVNVYIPTYKPQPEHLKAALDSLCAQTFADWTALVHDDASGTATSVSTDGGTGVRAIVEPYLKDGRILFMESGARRGIGGNWNACLTHGDAPFVQYLFQDDWWEPDYLQRSSDALKTDAGLAFAAANHVYVRESASTGEYAAGQDTYDVLSRMRADFPAGKQNGKDYLMDWLSHELHPNLIGEPSFVLMRREHMEKAGAFLEDMPQCLDLEYWTRLLMAGNWYFCAEKLGSFRVHSGGASAQNFESGAGMQDRLRCFQLIIEALPAGKDRQTAVAARNRALDTMVAKYFARAKSGKSMAVKGNGALKKFCLLHPLLMLRAIMRYWFRR